MAIIDIRHKAPEVDEIVFADMESGCCNSIHRHLSGYIEFKDSTDEYVLVNKANVENLIRALQKAIELGWTK